MAGDSVYGLHGDLLNVRDYECDSTDLAWVCQENQKSDPGPCESGESAGSSLGRRLICR